MNASHETDEEFWNHVRERVTHEAATPPTYDEFLARSQGFAIPAVRTDEQRRGIKRPLAVAAVLIVLASIGIGRYLVPSTNDAADTSILSIPSRVRVLENPPTGDDGPPCWVSLQDGQLDGGCRTGSLRVVEYGRETGSYVDGWNNDVSFVSVPAEWDVHTYHQMWSLGAAENSDRQGFLHHPGGTTTDLASGPQPIIRDQGNANWDYCRSWNAELFANEPAGAEPLVDKNMQCLHIEPATVDPDSGLVLASTNPPETSRLEIFYQPLTSGSED